METKKEIAKDLGSWIKYHRHIACLSQTEFWKRITDKPYLNDPDGLCELWVTRIETGYVSELNKMVLKRIADVLKESDIERYLLKKDLLYLWSKFESIENDIINRSHDDQKTILMISDLLESFHEEDELGIENITVH